MLTGSSALHYEPEKQVTSSRIRATLQQNSYGVSAYQNYGASLPSANTGKAILWNNYAFIGNGIYNESGSTRYGYAPAENAYLSLGNTLAVYERSTSVSRTTINAYFTSNGLTWSGATSLFKGISTIDVMAVTAEDTIYFRERLGTSYISNDNCNNYNYILKSRVYEGATWREYIIDGEPDWIYRHQRLDSLDAHRVGEMDQLVYLHGSSIYSRQGAPYTLRTLTSDGKNAYRTKDLFEPINKYGGIASMSSNIAKGPSHYYLGLYIRRQYIDDEKWQQRGVSSLNSVYYGLAISKSKDMVNWGVPILTNQ